MKVPTISILLMLMLIGSIPFLTLETGSARVQSINFAVIFAAGGLGDMAYNDAAWRGMELAESKFGSDISIDYVEPETIPEFATFQNDLAAEGKYDLIICIGFLQTNALNETARSFPNQKFVLIDDILDLPNVQSITFKEHEGSFLVGAMAAMTTNTNKLGFLGGLDIYLINKYRAGYEQGAHYINSTVEVTSVYSPDPTNPWGDIAGGKAVGETLFSQGIDIVYAAAGGTGLGIYEAADEGTDVMAIGVDFDKDYLYPGTILCSMLKKVETAVFTSIDTKMLGTWNASLSQLGIAEDGVGISGMYTTTSIRDGFFEFNGETKTRGEWIEWIKCQISMGTIYVYDVGSIPWTTTPIPCNTSSSMTSWYPYTTTPSSTTTVIPQLTHSWALIVLILSLGFVVILKRKN